MMKACQHADIILFGLLNRLLRQIITQHQRRISLFHGLLALFITLLILQQTLTINVVPAIKRFTVNKFITQRRTRLFATFRR